MMLTSVGVVLFLLCGYKKEWGRVCLKVFFRRSFDKRKDMAVFCIGKMFDRKMFLIINNDKYIALNFSSICNICNQLKSSYF